MLHWLKAIVAEGRLQKNRFVNPHDTVTKFMFYLLHPMSLCESQTIHKKSILNHKSRIQYEFIPHYKDPENGISFLPNCIDQV